MSGWPLVALREVFEIARGGSPRPIDDFITDDPAGINWIMISDASEGSKYITGTRKRIRPEGAQRSRGVKPGDFLLTNSMSFGKPYIMRISGCIHDGWLVLSPRSGNVDGDFFYHLLGSKAVYSEFERRAAGATVKNLNIDLVSGVKILLPPFAVQRRIAEVLDNADALRAKRRAVLAQLDILTRSIFVDMFGDPATNLKGVPTVPLGDISEVATGGTPSRDVSGYFGGEIPWVKTTEVKGEPIHDTEEKLTESGLKAVRGKLHPINSIVIAMYGQGKTRGQSGILAIDAAVNQACAVVRPSSSFDSIFMLAQLRLGYERLRAMARGGNQENLNLELVRSFRVLLPPLAHQGSFVERISAIEKVKTSAKESLAELGGLFASLQHRAFRGEL